MSKEAIKKEDNINRNIKKSHQYWNYWKSQIYWNNMEWVVTKSRNVKKKHFLISSHKFYIKDKTYTNNWFVHSLMKTIDVDELFNRRFIISEVESSLNDDDQIESPGITEGQTET